MNREELEKMFDKEFDCLYVNEQLKQFIFDTIIPEVLKSLLNEHDISFGNVYVKQKAKELYNINL